MTSPSLFTLVVTTISLVSSGCVALKSTSAPEGSSVAAKPRVGNYYFLPRGVIQLDGVAGSNNDFQVTITKQNVPDKEHRYFLRHRANVFYDDDVQLKINGKGLLETANLTSEDKTPAIIDKVTETFIDIARISASGPTGFFRNAAEIERAVPLKPFHVIFDPFDTQQRRVAVTKLKDCGFSLKFPNSAAAVAHMAADAKNAVSVQDVRSESRSQAVAEEAAGVIYRPPTAVELEISTLDNSQAGLLQHVWIRLPNPGEIAIMDASRSFLVKKKNNYTLIDGDLVQIDHNRPSQALAFVSIPASVVHKVAEAIPTLISIQDKRATRVPPDLAAQKAQLDAQTAVLNSKTALLEAQQKLQKAQGDETSNRALTREALREQAVAEKEEALARIEKARADKEEALSRSTKSREARERAPSPP